MKRAVSVSCFRPWVTLETGGSVIQPGTPPVSFCHSIKGQDGAQVRG